MSDFLVCGLVVLTGLTVVFTPIVLLDKASCASKAQKMEMNHSWGPLQGCMVEDQGRWWPIERYLVVTPNG